MISQEQLASVINDWWYYSVELAPGVVTKGADTPRTPMLPRMMMRNCDLAGMACLDIGSMEGLIPALMARKGASRVVATDAIPHCAKKMDVLKAAYGVQFDFHQIGLIYDLSTKLSPYGGFDFINLSGVLYHVFSPMHVLAGVRPLLKKNGLMVVSTNVIKRGDHTLTFNHQGSLQRELNTFWYHSVPMLDYLLRTFKLVPIDFLFCPHTEVNRTTSCPGCRAATCPWSAGPPTTWTATSPTPGRHTCAVPPGSTSACATTRCWMPSRFPRSATPAPVHPRPGASA